MVDAVLHGGRVLTVDAGFRRAQAVAVGGDRILAVGADDEILALAGPRTRRIPLDGATVLPGLIDSHNHMVKTALGWRKVDLHPARSVADVQARLRDRAGATPPGRWVEASPRWHETRLAEGRLPNRWELDQACPHHPVYVPRGGHVAVANSLALRLAGVADATPDPVGGTYVRDASGALTGVMLEPPAFGPVQRLLPATTHAERVAAIREGMRRYNAAGLTSVRDPLVSPEEMRAYQDVWAAGEMTLRVNLMPAVPLERPTDAILDWLAALPLRTGLWRRLAAARRLEDPAGRRRRRRVDERTIRQRLRLSRSSAG